MPLIYFGIRNYLGATLENARAIVQPLSTLPVGQILRLPAKIYINDSQSIELPTGDYRVVLSSNNVTVKGHFTVGSADADFSTLFVEDNGSQPLPPGTPISNIVGLQSTLDTKVDTNDPRLVSLGGGTLAPNTFTALTALSALRVVVLRANKWQYASDTDTANASQSLALTLTSAVSGATLQPLIQGIVTDSAWNWDNNTPIYLGANGTLTQVNPTASVYRVVATAINPTQIFFNPSDGVLL